MAPGDRTDVQLDYLAQQLTQLEGRMIDPREFGRLEAEVKQLASLLREMNRTLGEMRDQLEQAKGGWRAVAYISGVAATLGAAVAWLWQHVTWKP